MYKTFEDARAAALEVIAGMGGDKKGCVVTERKNTPNSKKSGFNFRFFTEDSGGKFIPFDGAWWKYTRI